MNPFQSLHEYEEFIYTLRQRYPNIKHSTLVLIRRGRRIAILQGDVLFDRGFRISVKERLSDEGGSIMIEAYGYEIWHESEKIAWYDAQPHPGVLDLQSAFPHHKHIPPDIKHHRIPSPNMSFERPNLPHVIQEIEALLAQTAIE